MKKSFLLLLILGLFALDDSNAQKLKDLGLKKAKNRLKGLIEETTKVKPENEKSDESSNSTKSLNKRMSREEVLETLDAANSSYKSKKYSDARFSINQALVEIEQQLGEKVLAEMPKEALGQAYDPDEDLALSTGVGFIGLEIKREYPSNNGNVQAIIANNSALFGPYRMAMTNPQYISQNENMKSVSVDGRRGILELDGDTYKLVLPFGQSSLFMLQCDPCKDESAVTGLAKKFDLGKYLEILGEAPITTK